MSPPEVGKDFFRVWVNYPITMNYFSRLISWLRSFFSKIRPDVPKSVESSAGPKHGRSQNKSLRKWLMDNNYTDVVETIDRIRLKWKQEGKATRRNWWDVLAGDRHGNPRKIEGIEIPVLKAAQVRQGKSPSLYAICRNAHEEPPPSLKKSKRDPDN
jgi:hypothetical protein